MEKIMSKKNVLIIILLGIAITSMFFSKVASSPTFHAETIKALDDKKMTVMELTAAMALTSTAITAIPGESTTPLANQIMELSSYLLIVVGTIFLEKILLSITGYVTFSFAIPISCILFAIYLFIKNDVLREFAIKIALFGIAIFMVIPVSVKIGDLIEDTHNISVDQMIEDTEKTKKEEKNMDKDTTEEGFWSGLASGIKDFTSSIGDNVSSLIDKAEKTLSNFIDAIAVLLITSCVIPIIVLLFFLWLIKIIFGISIPIKKIKKDSKKQV